MINDLVLTAEEVKKFAKAHGADLVGISPMSRFEGAPKQNDARYIFPGAKSMIVLGFRVARGTLRGIEEGTYFAAYPSMGYATMNQVMIPMVLHNVTGFIEDCGYEAVPLMYMNASATSTVNGKFRTGYSRAVSPDKPYPDVFINLRIAAYMAGLGEFGWSKIFLTPEYGPRTRFACILTDAELEPDPIYEGHICDRCKQCVMNCGGKAISKNESVKVTIAGHEVEWGKLDEMACERGLHGGDEHQLDPFNGHFPNQFGYGRAVEGACGCMRACMVHLENRNKLLNTFYNQFREKGHQQWTVDHSKPYELTEDVMKTYVESGMMEDMDVYIEYNAKDNYGTAKKESKEGQID